VGNVCRDPDGRWIIVSKFGRCEEYEETARELAGRGVKFVRIYERKDELRIEAR